MGEQEGDLDSMLGTTKDFLYNHRKTLRAHFKALIFFLLAPIVAAESNKLNLETRYKNCLLTLKALTLISLCYRFSNYDLCFSQSWSTTNVTIIQKEAGLLLKL